MSNSHFTSIARSLNTNVMGEDLQKGHLIEAFMYGSDKIKVTKTGKQIKDSILPKLQEYNTKADQCLIKSATIKSQIPEGILATESLPSYWFGPYESKFDPNLRKYSWKSCEECVGRMNSPTQMGSMIPEAEDSLYSKVRESLCEQYNDEIRRYCEYKVEAFLIETIINGLSDTDSIDLSIPQAATLGF